MEGVAIPRHIPVPLPVLEGDYSAWAQKWVIPVDEVDVSYDRVHINVGGDRVTLVSYTSAYIIKISTGDLLTTLTVPYLNQVYDMTISSILRKYVVGQFSAPESLDIYKDGVLKQVITPVSAPDTIAGIGISSDGKYIVVGTVGPPSRVWCYEGS